MKTCIIVIVEVFKFPFLLEINFLSNKKLFLLNFVFITIESKIILGINGIRQPMNRHGPESIYYCAWSMMYVSRSNPFTRLEFRHCYITLVLSRVHVRKHSFALVVYRVGTTNSYKSKDKWKFESNARLIHENSNFTYLTRRREIARAVP